ncbi:NHLP leader peptide family RiPP precursor [Zobellia sp. B3R18]|uniref:NHLP leader peptide family RiPP precursor n=1 Tax=Zobellia sp. B3R18 TaxID=2841568 RepID=UPI001C072B2D|nr:NHLP leader peptide family RiPP precursor [Zobellia sp. B3R18]MBU2974975.1 NHLP leader peptide family RiPP precursor [Zobellia sp. B3R18]
MHLTESQENLNKIINKCWEDENFKNKLITSPKETIEAFFGKPIVNQNVTIVVNDQTDFEILNINIPAKPNIDSIALTDSELEDVAGGAYPTVIKDSMSFNCGCFPVF